MSKQNRVTATGEIVAASARGSLTGNRGCLHNDTGELQRQWARKQWLICVLNFRGRRRIVMAPGSYTELFFLDEATALASGHRPCATCQRARYKKFVSIWKTVFGANQTIKDIDNRLHEERCAVIGRQVLSVVKSDDLPDETMTIEPISGEVLLVIDGNFLLWRIEGYRRGKVVRNTASRVLTLMTPASTTEVIRAGYNVGVSVNIDGKP